MNLTGAHLRCLKKLASPNGQVQNIDEWVPLGTLQAFLGRDARVTQELLAAGMLHERKARAGKRGKLTTYVRLSAAGWRAWAVQDSVQ